MKYKKGQGWIFILAIAITVGVLISLGYFNNSPIDKNEPNQTTNKTNFTHSIYPKVSGDILTNNLTIICVSGYSSTVRDVPQSLREEVFARDNVLYPQQTGTTELDHIIPLCLGGSNDINNLFVEFAEPRPGYKEKDKLENYLCDHVCNGEINIDYAQQRIAEDWYKYYLEIYA